MDAFSLQGVSDEAALTYMARHGRARWRKIKRLMKETSSCPKLASYWSYHGCAYAKLSSTCARPDCFGNCCVPTHDLRNGRLNQLAYSLYLFIRDVADDDLVGWIDRQLARAEFRRDASATQAVNSLVEPLRNVFGLSHKTLNMALSDVLMAAPRTKPAWLVAGVGMIAVDTLVHNFLHRTGLVRRLGRKHGYGARCYQDGGCANILRQLAKRIDAREFNPSYPTVFPRFVQHALWRFCAQQEFNICNGNKIDDHHRCGNSDRPIFARCDRQALHPLRIASP
jgi:hypothetical protein